MAGEELFSVQCTERVEMMAGDRCAPYVWLRVRSAGLAPAALVGRVGRRRHVVEALRRACRTPAACAGPLRRGRGPAGDMRAGRQPADEGGVG